MVVARELMDGFSADALSQVETQTRETEHQVGGILWSIWPINSAQTPNQSWQLSRSSKGATEKGQTQGSVP
jgi:hypothetical protein